MNRTDLPEIRRPAQGRLEVWIPWRETGNRALIKSVCGSLTRPEWDCQAKRWLIARGHFVALIEALKAEFGQVRVITWHCNAERCDIRCLEAKGPDCQCSCGGRNHGGLNSYARGWRLSGTVATVERGWSEWVWVASAGMSATELLAYVTSEAGRLTGERLPVPGAEQVMAGFIQRFGARDATRIARAAFEVHHGMWMGAPITPRRFTAANDEFFARPILAQLDRAEGRRAA